MLAVALGSAYRGVVIAWDADDLDLLWTYRVRGRRDTTPLPRTRVQCLLPKRDRDVRMREREREREREVPSHSSVKE